MTAQSPPVELDDTMLSMMLDTNNIIARSLADATGLFWFCWQMTHAGADSQSEDVNPYAVGSTLARGPYPASLRGEFDVWLVSAYGRVSVESAFTDAGISYNLIDPVAFRVSQTGAAITGTPPDPLLVHFDSADNQGGNAFLVSDGKSVAPIGLRVPRDSAIRVDTKASAAVAIDIMILAAVFPAGLGQDVSV